MWKIRPSFHLEFLRQTFHGKGDKEVYALLGNAAKYAEQINEQVTQQNALLKC